ncbi:hypothetical protein I4U23_003843 [Adineta vaga]|nr:hypothetical protein I4U23_003843 [Adineta vaga]
MDMNLLLGPNTIPYGQPMERTGMIRLENISPQMYGFHCDPLPSIGDINENYCSSEFIIYSTDY